MTYRPTFGEERTSAQVAIDAAVLERVKRGVALLEKEHGPNWADKIDLDELELSDTEACVLGQLYSDFEDGMETLWPSYGLHGMRNLAFEHGFYEHPNRDLDDDEQYDALQEAWEHVLSGPRG